jgi:uncharacterized protein (TIGR03435 family)
MQNAQTLRRKLLLAAGGIVVVGAISALRAQAPGTDTKLLALEVASVKRNTMRGTPTNRASPGRVTVTNALLQGLVRSGYGLKDFQVVGGPDWVRVDRWDIVAKATDNASQAELDAMMRSLLADRFKLIVHNETRRLPIYALVPTRTDGSPGPEIHASSVDCSAAAEARAQGVRDGRQVCGFSGVAGNMVATGRTIVQLARVLTPLVGRAVADKTGLTGSFDWTLKWAPLTQAVSDGPSLITALQEQLGLKLEAIREPMEVLVIDHVEQPTPD